MMVIQLFDFRKESIGAIMSLQQRSTPPRGAIHASSSNRDLCLLYLTVTGQALALTVPRWQRNPVRYSDRPRSYGLPGKGWCTGTSPLTFPYERPPLENGKLELAITHGSFVTGYHSPPFATDLVRANYEWYTLKS